MNIGKTLILVPMLVAAACGNTADSDTSTTGADTSGGTTTMDGPVTTTPASTMTNPTGNDDDPDSTGMAPDTSDTAASSTDGSSSGSSSGSGSSDTSSSNTGSGDTGTEVEPYAQCAGVDNETCPPDCFSVGGHSYCTSGCTEATDCPGPDGGDAPATCGDPGGFAGFDICYLDCSGKEACPDGMDCIADPGYCAWPFVVEGGGECPDADNGSATPQSIMGDNTGLLDDHSPTCAGQGGGEDALHQFTAPNAAVYTFAISESSSDTSMFILDGCGGDEIACNDDIGPGNFLSEVEIELAAKQTVIVGVDSWNGEVGPYTLTITETNVKPPG